MKKKIRLTILVSARKNSKYLAKFLAGLYTNLLFPELAEVYLTANAEDTWNTETVQIYQKHYGLKLYIENSGLGRGGLHEYFNTMVADAHGDWIVYFCEDHYTNVFGWDGELYKFINAKELKSTKPICIVPKFDNVGAMNHILSRGYVRAMGGYLGRHGNIDSYINKVNRKIGETDLVYRVDEEWFHDFTHDIPDQMDPIHSKVELSEEGRNLPRFDRIDNLIQEDANKVMQKMGVLDAI